MFNNLRNLRNPFYSVTTREGKKKSKIVFKPIKEEMNKSFNNALKNDLPQQEFYQKMSTGEKFYTHFGHIMLGVPLLFGFYYIYKGIWHEYLTVEKINYLSLSNKFIAGSSVLGVGVLSGLLYKSSISSMPTLLTHYYGVPTFLYLGAALIYLNFAQNAIERNFAWCQYFNLGMSGILFSVGLFLVRSVKDGKMPTFFSNSMNSYFALVLIFSALIFTLLSKEKKMQREFVEDFKRRQEYVQINA